MSELLRVDSIGFVREPQGPPPQELYWTCDVCGVVEPLLIATGRYIKRSCACQRAAREVARQEQERQERMQALAARTYGWLGKEWSADMEEMKAKTFADYDPRKQSNEVDRKSLQIALAKCKAFAEHPQGVLLLHGSYGLGKTHLLASVCNRLRERGTGSLFTTSPKFFSAFYDRMGHTNDEWDLVKWAIMTPLFVIDDLDKATPKEFRKEVFYQIIDERVKARRPIGISTNQLQDFSLYIGEASFSRIMDGCQPLKMSGVDIRSTMIVKG